MYQKKNEDNQHQKFTSNWIQTIYEHVAVRVIDGILNKISGDGDEMGEKYSPITSIQLVWDTSSNEVINFKIIVNS